MRRRVRAGACVFVVYTVSEISSLTHHIHIEEQQPHQYEEGQPRHHGLYSIQHIESVSCYERFRRIRPRK